MDEATTFHHRLGVAPAGEDQFHVFVRNRRGQVAHYWTTGGVMFGPEQVPAGFDTDPLCQWEFRDDGTVLLHLLGRANLSLVDLRWTVSGPPAALGAPERHVLPGVCATEPVVVGGIGRIDVFTRALFSQIRTWRMQPDGTWTGPETLTGVDASSSRPAVVSRGQDSFDMFGCSGGGLTHWFTAQDGWHSEPRRPNPTPAHPVRDAATVVSNEPNRLDVFVSGQDGVPVHWGFNGQRWFDEELRLTLNLPGTAPFRIEPEPQLVSFGPRRIALFAPALPPGVNPSDRAAQRRWFGWMLGSDGKWSPPRDFGPASPFPVHSWSPVDGRIDLLARNADGSFNHQVFVGDTVQAFGGAAGGWTTRTLPLVEPPPTAPDFVPAVVDPDLLLLRRDDMVLLGVRWTQDVELRPATGGAPATLVAAAGTELTVLFPPQHLGEGVVSGDGPAVPPVPAASTGGFPTWPAAVSGPSRLVVRLDAGHVVPLTADGLLDALRRGQVVPSIGPLDEKTTIELPLRLVMSPAAGAAIRAQHAAAVVTARTGSVGLWNTRISSDAGLTLQPLRVDDTDPFELPLSAGSRVRILNEEPIARIERLRLSPLGGTLTAAGSWAEFEWEHDAALGRDRRVRTVTRGVLYPFGHRAEYVELTERVFESGAEGATAHLRQQRILVVTEPIRAEPDDAELSRAFPFASVRIDRTVLTDLDRPVRPGAAPATGSVWGTRTVAQRGLDVLESIVAQRSLLLDPLREELDGGDMGPAFDQPPYEDMATDDSDPLAFTAEQFLDVLVQVERDQAAVDEFSGESHELDVFFVPHVGGRPVRFPVTLAGSLGDVHVETPLVFVADLDVPDDGLWDPFESLTDFTVLDRVRKAHEAAGGDVVETGGVRIDMVRAAQPAEADVCEVQRLHVVGDHRAGGFRPRLGMPVALDEPARPPADRWGFELALPAVRALLGPGSSAGQRPMRVAMSRELLRGQLPQIPFQVPFQADGKTVDAIVTDFARNTARGGGIMAPDLKLDGISRDHGPVSVDALLAQLGGDGLDPVKLLGNSATLLGFNLAELLVAKELKDPPKILTSVDGDAPKVTMIWQDVKLTTTEGSFLTEDNSRLTLTVELGTAGQNVTCTVDKIGIALPAREDPPKQLELRFDQIRFAQQGSRPPTLEVSGPHVTFFGYLKLLEDLQKAADFGSGGPRIDASEDGIRASYDLPVPDVTTGGFQLTGLVFHAMIDVPFDGGRVTVGLGFASREDPFNVSVLALGGGGYVDVLLDKSGLRRLELSLEFGASMEVDFRVASGEVHVMGGIRMIKEGEAFSLAGFLRFGGSVEVLGLVSVSVELLVTLTYESEGNRMVGRGTLVLEVDLGLWSDSVELDTGPWVIAGDEDAVPVDEALLLEGGVPPGWLEFRSAFAEEPLP